MENLYIETLNGNIRIPRDIVESQRLKRMLTPFTRFRIVGRMAIFRKDRSETKRPLNEDSKRLKM